MKIYFSYADGSNPYITLTDAALFRMICKYNLRQTWTHNFVVESRSQYLTVKREKLTAYEKAKTALREFAMNWQYDFERFTWFYSEICEYESFFRKYGKKYGLLREFQENGIC